MNLPQKQAFEGKLEVNPWGNWSDVDRGVYLGGERLAADMAYCDILAPYEGRRIRLTIELLPDEEKTD